MKIDPKAEKERIVAQINQLQGMLLFIQQKEKEAEKAKESEKKEEPKK